MRHQFAAIIGPGEKYLIATSPEVAEAHGQGSTREECLRDLADSIQSVLEYRHFATGVKSGKLDTLGAVADRAFEVGECRVL